MLPDHTKGIIYKSLVLGDTRLISDDLSQMGRHDWDDLTQITTDHLLGPLLYQSLSREAIINSTPPKVIENLRTQYQLHRARNLNTYQKLAELTELLTSNNIASVALKGAYLSIAAYPDIALRPMRDLDLLISRTQALPAYRLLIANGFKRIIGSGGPEPALELAPHLPALASPKGVVVELHHRLTNPETHTNCFMTENIWSRAIHKKVGKASVQFPSPEDLLIHLCEHASIHHLFTIGPMVLSDINCLIKTHALDWGYLLQATKEYQLTRALLVTLMQVSSKLSTKIPEQVLQTLAADQLDPGVLNAVDDLMLSRLEEYKNTNDLNIKLFYSNSVLTTLRVLVSRIFVPRLVIADEFNVSAGSLMVYFHYPRRWYRQITHRVPMLIRAYINKNKTYKLAMQKQQLRDWLQNDS